MKDELYSYELAKLINKPKDKILKDIRNNINKFNSLINVEEYFTEDTYLNLQNKNNHSN